MGKKKQTYIGIGPHGSDMICDSWEEVHFTWWLKELKDRGFVDDYMRSKTYALNHGLDMELNVLRKRKGKLVEVKSIVNIIPAKEYTPDFIVRFNKISQDIFYTHTKLKYFSEPVSVVEVKPAFDFKNMTRLAQTNIAFLHATEGIVTDLTIPSGKKGCLFEQTFTPNRFLFQDMTNKKRTITKFKVRTLDEFLAMEASLAIQENIIGNDGGLL
jgi:hypothetical protein